MTIQAVRPYDELMDELAKIRRVIAGRLEGAPHETLLVIDATTGQNGLVQARQFSAATPPTGSVLTTPDGTAIGPLARTCTSSSVFMARL